ncbi:MAG: GNAT family N-acetyltransferase, cg3035/Rv0428c family, partial [Gemmatimonadota bacterium]
MSRNRRPTLDHASGIRLEQASLKAWPAIEQTALDGWLLRYSEGVTKRANSVQALGGSNMPFAEKIERCERWYAVRERPCIFRLTPFSEAGLDARLAERGYANIDATAVLERPLDGASAITATDSGLRPLTLDAWVDTYARLHGLADGTPAPLRSILDSIAAERLLA